MADKITITGYLRGTERAGMSSMGNPNYRLIIEDLNGEYRTYVTQSNASLGYGITNPEYRNALCEFELTKAHRVKYARIIESGKSD
jgi:heat shock protein HspQ